MNINSAATTDLVIRRIDLGGETDATRGLAGPVRITDTSRQVAGRGFPITDFVRNGNVLEVYNNTGAIGNVAYNVKVGEDAAGLPLREVFLRAPVSLIASGAITDVLAADAPRILTGGSAVSVSTADRVSSSGSGPKRRSWSTRSCAISGTLGS